jgi:cell division transport system permease protein
VGLVTVLTLLANQMSDYVKENISFTIVLRDSVGDESISNIQDFLKTAPYVHSTEYISKERAIKELSKELGEDPENFLGYNPLNASIEVKTKPEFANNSSMAKIEQELLKFSGIKEVIYQKNVVELVNENIKLVSIILLGIAVLLLFISISLINNTIRLQIYSKRFTINTMKLVGATAWFIRKPFLIKGLMNGIIASCIASTVLWGLIYYFQFYHFPMLNLLSTPIISITCGNIFFIGIVISLISSLFSVGKYLRIKTNDLYYI